MDKYEYNLKLEEIDKLVDQGDYKAAANLADTIEWRRVRNVRTLCLISEIYEAAGNLAKSKEMLERAYRKSPVGRTVLYRLVEVTTRLGQFDEALEYYSEYVQTAPHDNNRYILKYMIYKGRGSSPEELIGILEEYLGLEYTERWAYELASVYQQAGQIQKCLAACDDLVLWFHSGNYVKKALELKKRYAALTPKQQQIYEVCLQDDAQKEYLADPDEEGTVIQDSVTQDSQETDDEVVAENILAETEKEIAGEIAARKAQMEKGSAPKLSKKSAFGGLAGMKRRKPDETETSAPVNLEIPETEKQTDLNVELAKSMRKVVSGVTRNPEPNEDDIPAVVEERLHTIRQTPVAKEPVRNAGKLSIDDILLEMGEKGKQAAQEARAQREAAQEQSAVSIEPETTQGQGVSANGGLETGAVKGVTEDVGLEAEAMEGVTASEGLEAEAVEGATVSEGLEAETMEGATVGGSLEVKTVGDVTASDGLGTAVKQGDTFTAPTAVKGQETAALKEAPSAGQAVEDSDTDTVAAVYERRETDAVQEPETEESQEPEKIRHPAAHQKMESEMEPMAVQPSAETKTSGNRRTAADTAEPGSVPPVGSRSITAAAARELTQEQLEALRYSSNPEKFLKNRTALPSYAAAEDLSMTRKIVNTREELEAAARKEMMESKTIRIPAEEIARAYTQGTDRSQVKMEKTIQNEAAAAMEGFGEEGNGSQDISPEQQSDKTAMDGENQNTINDASQEAEISHREETLAAEGQESYDGEQNLDEPSGETFENEEYLDDPLTIEPHLRGLFKGFTEIEGIEDQIANAILQALSKGEDRTSRTGNILIFGPHSSGKTTLATSLAKAIAQEKGRKVAKMARIYGADLNRKDIAATIAKIAGGMLIVEEAGDLDDKTVEQLTTAMEFRTDGLIVILEDEQRYVHDLLMKHPRFTMKFTAQIYLPEYTADELCIFAQQHANELDYMISEEGFESIRRKIAAMADTETPMSVGDTLALVDKAIRHSNKFMRKMSMGKKRYDPNDYVLLFAKDFK
ncbi:MAG: hypothetical protein LUG99_07145 [Lachnospiraceae bacterium]|nr:hypothetical protein [Lachnospiraceae bacterium]